MQTPRLKARSLVIASVLTGLTSITAQIVILREFLSAFQENELFLALGLTGWMSLVAVGIPQNPR